MCRRMAASTWCLGWKLWIDLLCWSCFFFKDQLWSTDCHLFEVLGVFLSLPTLSDPPHSVTIWGGRRRSSYNFGYSWTGFESQPLCSCPQARQTQARKGPSNQGKVKPSCKKKKNLPPFLFACLHSLQLARCHGWMSCSSEVSLSVRVTKRDLRLLLLLHV